jgi:transcriptional regulator with XRE-family HTH domain
VTEDWAAIATAINQRMTELGLRQHELIERSRVSKTAVREIQHNTAQRRRSARTLEALSVALSWHPQHLAAVLDGRRPPQVGDPVVTSDHDVPSHLASIERRLSEITDRLDDFGVIKGQLDQISADLSVVIRRNGGRES